MKSFALTQSFRPFLHAVQAVATALLLTPGLLHAADAAQALTDKLARQNLQMGEVVEYVQNYRLDGWSSVDSKHLVIHTGPSSQYLITLQRSCPDLSTAENIAFTSTVRKLTKFDKLIVRGAGGIKQDCPIAQINALTKVPKQN